MHDELDLAYSLLNCHSMLRMTASSNTVRQLYMLCGASQLLARPAQQAKDTLTRLHDGLNGLQPAVLQQHLMRTSSWNCLQKIVMESISQFAQSNESSVNQLHAARHSHSHVWGLDSMGPYQE